MKHYIFAFLTSVVLSAIFAIAFYPVVNQPITLSTQKTANTRYFFVAYDYPPGGSGNMTFFNTQFPANDKIRKDAAELCGKNWNDIVLTAIYEFKNETDFNNFRK